MKTPDNRRDAYIVKVRHSGNYVSYDEQGAATGPRLNIRKDVLS